MLLALLTILASTGLLASFLWRVAPKSTIEYAVMIDCGSTGSRVYIYKWSKRYTPSLPEVFAVTGANGLPLALKIFPGIFL